MSEIPMEQISSTLRALVAATMLFSLGGILILCSWISSLNKRLEKLEKDIWEMWRFF